MYSLSLLWPSATSFPGCMSGALVWTEDEVECVCSKESAGGSADLLWLVGRTACINVEGESVEVSL